MMGFATETLLPVKEPAKQTEPLETYRSLDWRLSMKTPKQPLRLMLRQ